MFASIELYFDVIRIFMLFEGLFSGLFTWLCFYFFNQRCELPALSLSRFMLESFAVPVEWRKKQKVFLKASDCQKKQTKIKVLLCSIWEEEPGLGRHSADLLHVRGGGSIYLPTSHNPLLRLNSDCCMVESFIQPPFQTGSAEESLSSALTIDCIRDLEGGSVMSSREDGSLLASTKWRPFSRQFFCTLPLRRKIVTKFFFCNMDPDVVGMQWLVPVRLSC